jgi:hypothetical protein
MFTLLIGVHREPHAPRTAEYLQALRANLANAMIERVILFAEHADHWASGLDDPKLQPLAGYNKRLTYADAFAHANSLGDGKLMILANSDIEFDEASLRRVSHAYLDNTLLCVTRSVFVNGRWLVNKIPEVHHFGADSWIFQTPLVEFDCDFPLGKHYCDWHLSYEAQQNGLTVYNPSRDVLTKHIHESEFRRHTYDDAVPGGHLYLSPELLRMKV